MMAGPRQNAAPNDLLREFVYLALTSKPGTKEQSQYSMLVKEFSSLRKKLERDASNDRVMMLANFITVLKDYVSLLREHQHDSIISEVLSIKLWSTAASVRAAVLDLVSTLVVVNTAFTHTCLRLLVASLLPPGVPPITPETAMTPWTPSEEEVMVQSAITGTLIKVLGLVPTAPPSLMQLVSSHMPHKVRDRHSQCMYLSAVFSLAEAPAGRPVRDALLMTSVEHLLSVDVDIRWEDIMDEKTVEAVEEVAPEPIEDLDEIFQLEGMTELDLNATPEQLEELTQKRSAQLQQQQHPHAPRGGWEGVGTGVVSAPEGVSPGESQAMLAARREVEEMANKLDSLMELVFTHLERRCQLPGAGGPAQAWSAVMACFERTILNAHRSKFSQFLVFYMCHKHPDPCIRLFVEFLISRFQDPCLPPITRSACAAYLASFVSRSAVITPALVLQCLDHLTRFAEQYYVPATAGGTISTSGTVDTAADLTAKHQVFYACVQAILYIVCYHVDNLVHCDAPCYPHSAADGPAPPAVSTAFRNLINGRVLRLMDQPLRPMQVCLASVVVEFHERLRTHGFTGLPATLKDFVQNKRQEDEEALRRRRQGLPTASTPGIAPGVQRPLEMFFPFDPYLLKRSARFLDLQHTYVMWDKVVERSRAAAIARGKSGQVPGAMQAVVDQAVPINGFHEHDGDAEEEEDGELDLDSSSSDTDSSSGTEDESSVLGQSMDAMGTSVGLPGSAMRLARPKAPGGLPPRGAHSHSHGRGNAFGHLHNGHGLQPHLSSGGVGSYKHGGMAMSYGDVMGTSYGTGAQSSMGDVTPTGSSPVVVEYFTGPSGGPGQQGVFQGASPMQMTPQYHSHMETVPGRLMARLR